MSLLIAMPLLARERLGAAHRHAVAVSFSEAAECYPAHAHAQRDSATDLLALGDWQGRVLDLGCGQGQLALALSAMPAVTEVLAVDISAAMLRQGRLQGAPKIQPIVADALQLPIAPNSLDAALSNFALHWCLSPVHVAASLAAVLKPHGQLALAVPLAGSLAELPGHAHPTLLPQVAWLEAFSAPNWLLSELRVQRYAQYYPDARQWLAGLQRMGVGSLVTQRLRPSRYRDLLAALSAQRTEQGIPMSFQVLQLQARRQGSEG